LKWVNQTNYLAPNEYVFLGMANEILDAEYMIKYREKFKFNASKYVSDPKAFTALTKEHTNQLLKALS